MKKVEEIHEVLRVMIVILNPMPTPYGKFKENIILEKQTNFI
jgi:hypothetical protein